MPASVARVAAWSVHYFTEKPLRSGFPFENVSYLAMLENPKFKYLYLATLDFVSLCLSLCK